jgi:hypothetical protein
MQARFTEIHEVLKKRSDTFLTEQYMYWFLVIEVTTNQNQISINK